MVYPDSRNKDLARAKIYNLHNTGKIKSVLKKEEGFLIQNVNHQDHLLGRRYKLLLKYNTVAEQVGNFRVRSMHVFKKRVYNNDEIMKKFNKS